VNEDFEFRDQNKRTILHKAALEQNSKLLENLIGEYCQINGLQVYSPEIVRLVNQQDMFGNNLLNLCTVNQIDQSYYRRLACIEMLLGFKAEPDHETVKLLWRPINWCVYNGDALSVKRLLNAGAQICYPDAFGWYMVDYAGKFVSSSLLL